MARLRFVLIGVLALFLSGAAAGAAGLCGGASCCASDNPMTRIETPSCCDDECNFASVDPTDVDRSVQASARPHLFVAVVPSIDPWLSSGVNASPLPVSSESPPFTASSPPSPLRL